MEGAKPPLTGNEVARACGVTPQAVSGWKKNGRVAKRHLETLAGLTGKDLSYFLSPDARSDRTNGASTHHDEFSTIQRAWQNASPEQKAILLTVAGTILERNAKRGKRAN